VRGLRVCRGHGIGFRSVEAVVHAARCRFAALRVRTGNLEAASLYERLGFVRVADAPDCTNLLRLGSDVEVAVQRTRHDVR
jgi:ribosomal protein S18 acetylase RimI-like enzyme